MDSGSDGTKCDGQPIAVSRDIIRSMCKPGVRGFAISLSFFLAAAAAQTPLERQLQARVSAFPGTVTLYAKNLDTGATVGIHEADPV